LGERVEVGVEEIWRKSRTSKSKGIKAIPVLKTSRENHLREEVVKLHIADHWHSTGTWRKLSI